MNSMIRHGLAVALGTVLLLPGTTIAQETNALTPAEQSLSVMAAFESKGDMDGLSQALNLGLDNGLTVAQEKEALSHLYAYTGFPRSLNALGQLQKVIAERQKDGKTLVMGTEDKQPVPSGFNSLKEGTRVQAELVGGKYSNTFAPRIDYFLKAHLFGDVFASKVLKPTEREIVTISAIAALPGCEAQLVSHCRCALRIGLDSAKLSDIPVILAKHLDAGTASRAQAAVNEVLGGSSAKTEVRKGIENSPWPIGKLNTALAQYFSGKCYLYPMEGGVTNVTFEPGCVNNWHIHHHGVQVLICVAGEGWYQEWGKAPVKMVPGTVIAVPEGVKHWHGAAKNSWFQHLAYMTNVEEGFRNEWLEKPDL